MILLIPLLNKSENGYQELKYSIRSQCKFNPITKCLLVGGRPDWYTGDHLPHRDYDFTRKEENIKDKTIAGAEALKDNFLYSNDDFFAMAPYPGAHNKGLLSECIKKLHPHGSYTRTLQNTMDRFGDVYNVDTHAPLMMDWRGFIKETWPGFGYGFKTWYCQLNQVTTTEYIDTKTDKVPQPHSRLYFSTTHGFRDFQSLENLYPKKSIFES